MTIKITSLPKYQYFNKAFLDELNTKISLLDLVSNNMTLLKDGQNYKGACPFHENEHESEKSDAKNSFSISSDYNRYYCYECHAKGGIINWVMHHEKLGFQEAILFLSEKYQIPLPKETQYFNLERNVLIDILENAMNIYRYRLQRETEALSYLYNERHLTSDSIEQFQLGIVTSGITQLLRNHFSESQLLESGIAIRSRVNALENIDLLRYRICIPIQDELGMVIGFAGRTYRKENSVKYLNTGETPLFQKRKILYGLFNAKKHIMDDHTAVIVEGFFDVIALHQRGENRAVGMMGTSIYKEQIQKLFKYADNLIFVFDGDEKGKEAILNTAFMAISEMNDNQMVYFVYLPQGEDPATYIHEHGLSAWKDLLKNKHSISQILTQFITAEMKQDKIGAIEKAKTILSQINNAEYFKESFTCHLEKLFDTQLD